MPQMNNLGTTGLQNPAHDIDRRIMTVEQTGSGDEADFMSGFTWRSLGLSALIRT
jgi:hypothetical protein